MRDDGGERADDLIRQLRHMLAHDGVGALPDLIVVVPLRDILERSPAPLTQHGIGWQESHAHRLRDLWSDATPATVRIATVARASVILGIVIIAELPAHGKRRDLDGLTALRDRAHVTWPGFALADRDAGLSARPGSAVGVIDEVLGHHSRARVAAVAGAYCEGAQAMSACWVGAWAVGQR